jgi:ATP-dependent DNA helicase RecQ
MSQAKRAKSKLSMFQQAQSVLRQYWGHPDFKPEQVEVVKAVLNGKDVFAVLPTGFGKSATFQIPGVVLPGTALVISPLIALMKDQVDDLNRKGVKASYVNSHIDEVEISERLANLVDGAYDLFYVAPERLKAPKFKRAIRGTKVSIMVVDECHSVSRWGHDFRPAYMQIKRLVPTLANADGNRPPVMAVTATATADIEDDVIQGCGLHNPVRVIGDPTRDNIHYAVWDGNEWANLDRAIRLIRPDEGRTVIYTGTRAAAELAAGKVREAFSRKDVCEVYHAGFDKIVRTEVQDRFKSGATPVVVATNAFGMGIDVPNIRLIVHFGIPGSVEDYVQETGRAGRDGGPSEAVLIQSEYIENYLRPMFIDFSNPPYEAYLDVWNFLHHLIKNPREPLGMSLAKMSEIMDEVGYEIGVRPRQDKVISGVLQTLDAYGFVERLPAGVAGTTVIVYPKPLQEALKGKELGRHGRALCQVAAHLLQQTQAIIEQQGLTDNPSVQVVKKHLAGEIGVRQNAVTRALTRLEKAKLIRVQTNYRGTSTKIVPEWFGKDISEHLPENDIRSKHAREQHRLDCMIHYQQAGPTQEGFRNYIRDYFESGPIAV